MVDPTSPDDLPKMPPAETASIIDRLVALGEQGMASGIDDSFDLDAFIEDARAGN